MKRQPLELLAPARDIATAREAILHGADAVYIGASDFGARSRAGNSVDEIRQLVEFAAPYGVKVYVTVNTIIFEDELTKARDLIRDLYRIGVDALIVQDLGILQMDIPPIALHASTQLDTRSAEKARMLEQAGFSQIVVARELNLNELRDICQAISVPVEAFVHGALCVSYSGDCQAGYVCNGRSANRGRCPQMCRLPYDLIDGDGKVIGHAKHYLSLRDLNRIDYLEQMAEAGVQSFKIEGRLKDPAYVKNVVAAYRRRLDQIIEAQPDKYFRPSRGISVTTFEPRLDTSFNRSYTDYFFTTPKPGTLATLDTPKSIGPMVGTVISGKGKSLEVNLSRQLTNGDGITYITPDGATGGFRANRVEASRIYLTEQVSLPRGTRLFLSYDRLREEALAKPTATRLIPVAMTLREAAPGVLVLEGRIDGMREVCVAKCADIAPAQSADNGYRHKTLAKLGGTIFRLDSLDDRLTGRFVAASILADLRRQLVDSLLHTLLATRQFDYRRPCDPALKVKPEITRHDNVANSLARRFYSDRGAVTIEPAIEAAPLPKGEIRVMNCRYCLRRELGACLKTPSGRNLKAPLYLQATRPDGTPLPSPRYRLDFDCQNCRMNVIYLPNPR